MGDILVGTCSWSDKSLVGSFYPAGLKPVDQISHYALQFPTVEINSSFYAIPAPHVCASWAEKTPPGFIFHAKAFGPITTHKTEWNGEAHRRATPEMLRVWEESMEPLESAGKLGYTLLQFPRWFMPNRENRDYIAWLRDSMPNARLAVEFRNAWWLKEPEPLLKWLREREMAHVCVDEPQTSDKASAPLVTAATRSDFAILRLHGRNTESWEKPNAGVNERFNYNYSDREIHEEILPTARALANSTERTFVLFNNVHNGYGVHNAVVLLRALSAEFRTTTLFG
jgi:uncharacterized protein YecE (DUF72 family)